ncbi:19314_t:CDS:2, partial [Gigaspora margarita]
LNRKQTTITKAFEISLAKPHNTTEQAIHNKAITEVIVMQNLSLSFTEEKMFKHFTKIVDSQWIVLGRKKIKSLIDKEFNQISSCLQYDLYQAKTVLLIADLWTVYSCKGYLNIIVIWINKNFELTNPVLAVTFLQYPHTADAILKCIKNVLEHLGLKTKVFSIMSNSGANIKLACNKLGLKWVPCSAHILNLISEHLELVQESIQRQQKLNQEK